MPNFQSSYLKIKRADKHIAELESLFQAFVQSDFYTVRIEHDAKFRTNFVCCDIDTSGFPFNNAALAIGDALHNLRTALDHLWYQVIVACSGKAADWTIFPVRDAGDKMVSAMEAALKKQQITIPVVTLVLDAIKPYQGGNDLIWDFTAWTSRTNTRCLFQC